LDIRLGGFESWYEHSGEQKIPTSVRRKFGHPVIAESKLMFIKDKWASNW
jgi:hypothetical protein